VFTTWGFLRLREVTWKEDSRQMMKYLIIANVFAIALDICLLFLDYFVVMGLWNTYKGMSYSIKLRLEFFVLSRLKNLSNATLRDLNDAVGGDESTGNALKASDNELRQSSPTTTNPFAQDSSVLIVD
jgi:hypothetical protein